ncbi:helix-turn-helix transcriptional regulator [Frankia sp. AiPs1]|uniref:helix-turn-helix domain-containing protein n=1 Tax=Frankia sp. AiPs1 TaxID=573493 RepID=UPI002043F41D|nr:helix-turn-helix transcriptional regulator [Frankia sp. AiPs1]MCM3922647.1 helix-turn-helix transcriptional regulator [Frankia sp. AiPs1]
MRDTVDSVLRKARLRQLGRWETVQEIHHACGVGLLRAHRLAHGWTLKDVVSAIREREGASTATLTHQRLSRWETHGEVPSTRYLLALCRLYETRPDRLGFGRDFEAASRSSPPVVPAGDFTRPQPPGQPDIRRFDMVDLQKVRSRLRDVLEPAASSNQLVDWWEGRAEFYNAAYRRMPHEELLANAAHDFEFIVIALERRQPLSQMHRLHRASAMVAGAIGVVCVDLGRPEDSYAWFGIGEAAAAQTGDRHLHAWIRTRRALAVLYYGTPEEAARIARAAAEIAGRNSSVAMAMAPAVEARALARLGRQREAEDALKRFRAAYSRYAASDQKDSGLISFPGYKARFYEGNVLARIGLHSAAREAQREALLQYPRSDRIDPALIRIDHSITLLGSGYVLEALAEGERTLSALSPADRGGTVSAHAQELARMVPGSQRRKETYRRFIALMNDTEDS